MVFFDVWRAKIAGATPVSLTRRAVLKTTAKTLVGWIAVAIVLSAGMVSAGPIGCLGHAWLGAAAVAQSAPSGNNSAEDNGRQAADLLRRARQAMAENDFAVADSLISQAEALGVRYGALYMGDTPKKARHDLERNRNASGAASPKSGALLGAFGMNANKKKTAPTADPFAGRTVGADAAASNAQQVTPLPKVPAAESSPLRTARLALAVGDVRRAGQFVEQARAMRATYQPLDDTPDRVASTISKYQEASSLDKNTEAYRRAYARSLMEQADALMRWGERDEAERLATRAAGMHVVYGPFEQKPQDLLRRIAGTRQHDASSSHATPASDPSAAGYAMISEDAAPTVAARQQVVEIIRKSREALNAGQIDQAESLARQAEQLRVPDSAFTPGEDRPGLLMLDIRQARLRQPSNVMPASGQQRILPLGVVGADQMATRAVYDPNNDPTRNRMASAEQSALGPDMRLAQAPAQPQPNSLNLPPPPNANTPAPAPGGAKTQGMMLFEQGEAALKARDTARAYELFRQAAARGNELDPTTAQRLQDHLQLLSRSAPPQPQPPAGTPMTAEAAAQQQLLARQILTDLAQREASARAMRETDPKGALAMLEEARKHVETVGLDSATRDQLLRRVDRALADTKQFIDQNRPQIELAEQNARVRQEVDRQQLVKIEVGEKLALLVDDFNKAMDDREFEKAQIIAKRAAELDPNNPVVQQILLQAKFVRNLMVAQSIAEQKENGFVLAMEEVDRADIPFAGDKNPLVFGDAREWDKLTKGRAKYKEDHRRQRTEREYEIEKKLRTPVSLQFTNAPLSKVLENLAKLAEVNLHLDPQGLAEEGVTTDTPVTIELRNDIMLKSALNLILEPLHLSYIIKDEVLKITSEQMRDGEVYRHTYNVADLVVPIPNFVPNPSMGLQGAYGNAMANVGFGGSAMTFGSSTSTPMAVVATRDGKGNSAMVNPDMLAQVSSGAPTMPGVGPKAPVSAGGPGGLGGGAQADFDSLIELITTTVKPQTWDSVGGQGSIAPFETNLSLVVSQTQEVHEELADLLEQLRRLQDLQVTIEVRFITLNDNFFERIGVSFDFDINTNANTAALGITGGTAHNSTSIDPLNSDRTAVVGMGTPTTFSSDLDIPFTQGSYALTMPQYGGYDATAGATLGFAILSDIEAYFFVQAAQADTRSNVLQAPKVTLFNGQQAIVSDTSQSPFVISVIPVVGDFAAAQQPVIVVLSEGTFMTVQAVVSNDRRFVRLTVVPFFSKIGDVKTFKFTGSETTTTDTTRSGLFSDATDPAKLWNNTEDNETTTTSGTTVQLPTFSYVTVTTTVSVPDGGTVLLGGIKRLSEDRKENGVPMLNKLPYISRLFKNVGIGRETESLMMMVTPRIIIQEEEEEKIGVALP